MRILIVPDKFKGTLTAAQAAHAIAEGWAQARPADSLELLPMSDGGDGFGQVLGELLQAEPERSSVVDAARRPVAASWWWASAHQTAIVESAEVIGLARLPKATYHPFSLDTYGLGCLLQEISRHGVRHCLVGIGGSATNDAGFGMALALGWEFATTRRQSIKRWTDLHELAEVHAPSDGPLFEQIRVAVDVQNPLLGPRGSTRVYGPQKGLQPSDLEPAERCLARLADVLHRNLGIEAAEVPGAGAAGGLGFGFLAFAGAVLEPGFELFSRHAQLEQRIQSAQLVITAEGALDKSTLMGKGVGQLARLCQERRVPCLALAGQLAPDVSPPTPFAQTHAIAPQLTSATEAQLQPAHWLKVLAERVARSWAP